jgi:hypothetical protein
MFEVRIHYLAQPQETTIVVYKALIHAGTGIAARKNRMKAAKVFEGRSNFYIDDLNRQASQGLSTWDLGYYSADEVVALKEAAGQIELPVEFILRAE